MRGGVAGSPVVHEATLVINVAAISCVGSFVPPIFLASLPIQFDHHLSFSFFPSFSLSFLSTFPPTQIWKKFDKDFSGAIDVTELKVSQVRTLEPFCLEIFAVILLSTHIPHSLW